MTKYKEYLNKMLEENKTVFDKFAKLHLDYSLEEEKYQDEFNKEGEKVLKIVHEWEDKLCKQSEKAGFGSYTGGLSEKFQKEVKGHFPLIDHIGIIVNKFSLKKIKLS